MLDYAGGILPAHGYFPYYLYRQSKMVGNLEKMSVGQNLGLRAFYNVYVMDKLIRF